MIIDFQIASTGERRAPGVLVNRGSIYLAGFEGDELPWLMMTNMRRPSRMVRTKAP